MHPQSTENDWLARARQAAKQGSAAAMHMYYSTFLVQHPDNGKVFIEFLEACRALPRANRQLTDITTQNAFSKLLPTQAPQKVLEACLEKLKSTPFDLDCIYKLAKTAQHAGW